MGNVPEKQSGPLGGVCSPNQYPLKFTSPVGAGDDSRARGAPKVFIRAHNSISNVPIKADFISEPRHSHRTRRWRSKIVEGGSLSSCRLQLCPAAPCSFQPWPRWEPRVPPHTSLPEAAEVPTSLPSIFLFMHSMRKHTRCLVSATLFRPSCWTLRVILETLDFLNESKNKLFEEKKILDSWHRHCYLFLFPSSCCSSSLSTQESGQAEALSA